MRPLGYLWVHSRAGVKYSVNRREVTCRVLAPLMLWMSVCSARRTCKVCTHHSQQRVTSIARAQIRVGTFKLSARVVSSIMILDTMLKMRIIIL